MKPIGFIYLTTNTVNGKIYIGKHELSEYKHCNSTYLGSGVVFEKALKKYGRKSFKRKILRLCFSLHELRIWEHVYIVKYKSTDRNIGYNIAKGDVNSTEYNPAKLPEVREKISKYQKSYWKDNLEAREKMSKRRQGTKASLETRIKLSKSHIGIKRTKSWIEKLSKSNSGSNHWAYGITFTDEHRKNLSKGIKGKMAGEKHPLFGKKMSEETRRKMSEKQKKRWENIRKKKQEQLQRKLGTN